MRGEGAATAGSLRASASLEAIRLERDLDERKQARPGIVPHWDKARHLASGPTKALGRQPALNKDARNRSQVHKLRTLFAGAALVHEIDWSELGSCFTRRSNSHVGIPKPLRASGNRCYGAFCFAKRVRARLSITSVAGRFDCRLLAINRPARSVPNEQKCDDHSCPGLGTWLMSVCEKPPSTTISCPEI